MRIAFWGWKNSFDYFQIGGTESFVRRLTSKLNDNEVKVDYIMYDAENRKDVVINDRLKLKYFVKFEDALENLKSCYDHVITIYLFPLDRLKFAHFRKKHNRNIKFHFVYTGWPDSSIKRWLMFLEAKLFPYNGKLFCISKRQYQYLKQSSKNVMYLMPPVPEEFFIEPKNKPINEKAIITFMGRIDPGKGIEDVIEAFGRLSTDGRYECSIYGIHLSGNKKSFDIHNRLKAQNIIKYVEVDRLAYSQNIEDMVRDVLHKTDIFVQPYKRLSSTIDTPLLILEAMANLCVVVTKAFGNIPEIYGQSSFFVRENNFAEQFIKIVNDLSIDDIVTERQRVYDQARSLGFGADRAVKLFLEALCSG